MVNKEKLKLLLDAEGMSISSKELDEVITIYTNLVKFFMEDTDDYNDEDIFGFVNESDTYLWFHDKYEYYYKVFINVVKMKHKNLLMYLDYILIKMDAKIDEDSFDHPMFFLLEYTNNIVEKYSEYPKYYRGYFRQSTERHTGGDLGLFIPKLKKSKYVPSYYIDIFSIYLELYDTYFENWRELDLKYGVCFDDFLEDTYFYFIENNILHTEPDCIISFLESFRGNIEDTLEKMNLAGFINIDFIDDDFIHYVDILYQSSKIKGIAIR